LPKEIDPETTCKTQQRALRFRRELRIANTRRERAATLVQLLSIWAPQPDVVLSQWIDQPKRKLRTGAVAKELHSKFRNDVVTPFMDAWRQYLYRVVVTLLTEARATAAAARVRQNTLNYNDLLFKAAKLLRERADVRRALQAKFRWLFVDEFQDTDPVQAEIVFLLATDEGAVEVGANSTTAPRAKQHRAPSPESQVPEIDWRTVSLRSGALFVVGDPKQSIYRFRRADIEIYNLVRARIAQSANGAVVPLTTNFRSTRALCDWANSVFKTQFPPVATSESPQYAPLEAAPGERVGTVRHQVDPARPQARGVQSSVSGVCTLTVAAEVDKNEVSNVEAERIARFIRSEVDAGRRTYGDFLILTRKKSRRLLPYVQALEALQIPMEVSGAGAFAESREVKALALLLRALSDPHDAVSLVGVLRGPLFGVSDRELFAFRQAGGWFSIFCEAGQDSSPGDPATPVASALAALRQYHRWTRVLPAPAAVERMLEHTGYLALATTTPDGVEAGDLVHAVDRVRQVMERGGSLAEAAEALETDTETAGDIESLPLEPGRSAVVRIMNLHKAKGLEARVVFLADPCGDRWRHVSKRVERHADGARGWFSIEKDGDSWANKVIAQPAGWDEKVAEELHYLDAEETRLRYVAATRARDLLVVGRWAKPGSRGPWRTFEPFLGVPELPVPAKVTVPAVQSSDISEEARAVAHAERETSHGHAREATWSVTSVTAEARHIAKMSRPIDAMPDDPTQVVTAYTPARRADAGMAWGALIHGLLEHAMRHPNATHEDLRRLAMWLTVEEPHLRPSLSDAIETVQRVAQAEFWRSAQAAEHFEEAPFTIASTPRALTNGVIDLLFRSPEGWQIRDYKTSLTFEPAAHQRQLDAYRLALSTVGCGVSATDVVHVRTNET
jgi:ATP-dependent helicase/nuclease subunit A